MNIKEPAQIAQRPMKKKGLPQPRIAAEIRGAAPKDLHSGILILNGAGKLLYLNPIARDLLQATPQGSPSSGRNGSSPPGRNESPPLPEVVTRLHLYFKKGMAHDLRSIDHGMQAAYPIFLKPNLICSARAFPLQSLSETEGGASLLILFEPFRRKPDALIDSQELTEREQVVVQLLFDGKTNKEVAFSMGISEYTVKDHIKRIMKKLHAPNRAGIVAHFIQAGALL